LIDFIVFLLDVCRQVLEEVGVSIESGWTTFVGAKDLLKVFNFVDHIVMKAGLAEAEFVFAVAHVDLQVLVFRL
jgi:hypothetical protein